uniref:MutS protein like 4 n=1 Tax=Talaromyces marneffei PM1 TaxID=1077442 RepID=A0A093VNW4_TALMA
MSSILTTNDNSPSRRRARPRFSQRLCTDTRPTTSGTDIASQEVVGAISESRGISPTVGLAFVNLSTSEAVLCQICDSNSYARTINKLAVFEPTELLFMNTASARQTMLYDTIQNNIPDLIISSIDRRYWSDRASQEYVDKLAFPEELESIRVLKYIELQLDMTFTFHSLRIKFEASQGSMMIDLSTAASLELIQNLQKAKSRDCLFGLLNETQTPMGSRLLRTNILQPPTEQEKIAARYDAVEELSTKEDMFYAIREALKNFIDADKVLTSACATGNYELIKNAIDETLNDDVVYQRKPLDLRNQRTYAVKTGVNSLLDVARQAYKESNADAAELVSVLSERHNLTLELKYDTARSYYISLSAFELEGALPDEFINVIKRRDRIECQTLDLVKLNQRIADSHHEVISMSDQAVQELLEKICEGVPSLFRISEAIATLDMLSAFAHLVTIQEYVRPEITDVLAIKSGRHPLHEKILKDKFVPNDTYASQQSRFQIITGSTVDEINASVSTFAGEMREISYILRNVDGRSLVIVDELGRGTSTTDGLAIAIAIAEALVDSHAFVWFATHFRDLACIMAERSGVINLSLAVKLSHESSKMTMLYKIQEGHVQEKFYGLALAKVLPFPPQVLEVAQQVSTHLYRIAEDRAISSKVLGASRKRNLVLQLREQLLQAHNGNIDGEDLRQWLKRLQDDFAVRMAALEAGDDMSPVEDGVLDDGKNEEHFTVGQAQDAKSDKDSFEPVEEFDRTMPAESVDLVSQEDAEEQMWDI